MKTVFFGIVAAIVATAAQAGDQPVLVHPWVVYTDTGGVIYYKNNVGTEIPLSTYEMSATTTGVPGTPATQRTTPATTPTTPGGLAVRSAGLSPQASDALYAKLLKEAKARGLR